MKKIIRPQQLNPVFYERTKDGETFYDIQSRLVKDRVIFLSEPVTQDVGGTVSSLLFMMNNDDSEAKIQLWLNTQGGDIYALLAIYDMMQMIEAPVETTCIGMAMSAGAVLMAAGSKGKRLATPNSKFMIHQIQVGKGVNGTAKNVEISTENIVELNRDICEILAKHTGNSINKVMNDLDYDMYLNAKQALDYGIIDKILKIHPSKTVTTKKKTLSKVVKKPRK